MNLFALYIDPGTGSLIFQSILSVALTIILYFKKIKNFISQKSKNSKKNDLT